MSTIARIISYIIVYKLSCILNACPSPTVSPFFNCDTGVNACYGCTMECVDNVRCDFDCDTYTGACSNALIIGNSALFLQDDGNGCTGCVNTTIHAESVLGTVDWQCQGPCYGLKLYCGDTNTQCVLRCASFCNIDTKIYIPSNIAPTPRPSVCIGVSCPSVQIIVVTDPTLNPTNLPSNIPSDTPSNIPSDSPSKGPTNIPSDSPSNIPSDFPSNIPSDSPSQIPTTTPTDNPSNMPTRTPTNNTSFNHTNDDHEVIETTLLATNVRFESDDEMNNTDSINMDVIIGVLVGIFVLIILIFIVLLIVYKKRKNLKDNIKSIAATNTNSMELHKVMRTSSNQSMLNDKNANNDDDIVNAVNNNVLDDKMNTNDEIITKGNDDVIQTNRDNVTEGQANDDILNDEFEITGNDTQY